MPVTLRADEPSADGRVARAENLASEAFQNARAGRFDETRRLLDRAAGLTDDPSLKSMAAWTAQYQDHRKAWDEQRDKTFEKQVAKAQALVDAGLPAFAIAWTQSAFNTAADTDAFVKEPWVRSLIDSVAAVAAQNEKDEHWLDAARIYQHLTVIEPTNRRWIEHNQTTMRRIRLLAVYAPKALRDLQQAEDPNLDKVEQIIKDVDAKLGGTPTTQPAEEPGEKPDVKLGADEPDDPDKIEDAVDDDWHSRLEGVQYRMLIEALADVSRSYYQDIDYRGLIRGGIDAMRAVVTTGGLEEAFPTLKDKDAVAAFVAELDALQLESADLGPDRTLGKRQLERSISRLLDANKATIALPEAVILTEFADGAFVSLDDFTNMIWPADVLEFQKNTQAKFSGVGISIRNEGGQLMVISPLPDSPAWEAGIAAGDIISKIDGKSAKGITTRQAVDRIMGPEETDVVLTIDREGSDELQFPLTRRTINVASTKGWLQKPGGEWDWLIDKEQKIGYVRLTQFTPETVDELEAAINELKHEDARGLILDLRDNPGGLYVSAAGVADKFVSSGTIVSTRSNRDNSESAAQEARERRDDVTDLPVVVLINAYSASGSEIVSGALKDLKRATLVGERTFGKGSVQNVLPIANGRAYLKLTTSHYYLPSGRCIHKEKTSTEWGVDPDLEVKMTPEQTMDAVIARQKLDVLKRADEVPDGIDADAAQLDLLAKDPQLSAAVLLLRLQTSGGDVL